MDKTLSDKIAAEAAKQLAKKINEQIWGCLKDAYISKFAVSDTYFIEIVQSALSQFLAERDKEIEELVNKWLEDAKNGRPTYGYSAGKNACAYELRALLKGKAI